MNKPKIILSLFLSLFSIALIAGGIVFAPSFAGESRNASAAGSERQWLSIGQVHDKIEAAGYRNVEKIEREHGVYEARATDRSGARVKLYINPQTGEVAGQAQRQESRKHDRDGASSPADCTKRRCRDTPPSPAAR